MAGPGDFTLRKALMADVEGVERVLQESLKGISSLHYDPAQIASALLYVARLDRELIEDQTYYVAEASGEIVGCGGWSRRAKLYAGSAAKQDEVRFLDPRSEPARVRAMFVLPGWARKGIGKAILDRCEEEARHAGFRRMELMAMLSGEAMYARCGYAAVEPVQGTLTDGTPFPMTRMTKELS